MALHNLVITVVDGGLASSSLNNKTQNATTRNATDEQGNEGKGLLYKTLNLNQTIKNKMSENLPNTTFFAIESGYQVVKQTVKQVANYYISDIGRSNGDSNYQAQINRTVEVIGDVGSFFSGALSGAASGSAFGPIGAAVGAVVGLVSAGVSYHFKYAERERAYQHEMFQQNTSQAYNLARANYSALTGRVR